MADKMRTEPARKAYRRRKHIAEPPNGWIKSILGFRQFSLRGLHLGLTRPYDVMVIDRLLPAMDGPAAQNRASANAHWVAAGARCRMNRLMPFPPPACCQLKLCDTT